MAEFEFNKVYVLESLKQGERLTGKELYEDLLNRKAYLITDFEAEYISINNKEDFWKALEKIKDKCITEGQYPILHFEIHGSKDKDGLVLNSGELIGWDELYPNLVYLNSIMGNNLFITLAVCYGAFIMELIKIEKAAPYWGFIGSFEEILPDDLSICYNDFYNEFLTNYNLNEAIKKLHEANPSIPSTYRLINSEETFKIAYKKYFNEQFDEEKINTRFESVLKQNNFNLKDENNISLKLFKENLLKSKENYFVKHKRTFFMFDNFPDNENRFQINYQEF
ncbi:hypothetical protein VB796_06170 [Arcicella sp. LKC2W]|uniref:hypothetical protein n=1 Tax=Arcicella sp. LKC2W TaxID=2984198 RepID=UPI002B1F0D18|nr:hypothetical protein [Arcicella sp. LKC2W]MEA5458612.1 hypothetical protein [Arcicella sp. LKC2W]